MLDKRKKKKKTERAGRNYYLGRVKRKRAFRHSLKCSETDHPAHAQSITPVFSLHSYILYYPMILLADNEGPDQTARMRRLIWAFVVGICPKTRFSHGAAIIHIQFYQVYFTTL